MQTEKIGFGGGCHWCTEAYFQSLIGVQKVEQGWINSTVPNDSFSEAVVVHFEPEIIPLKILIEIHLHTHAATKNHSFRQKYRSAVYGLDKEIATIQTLINTFQPDFEEPIITTALPFKQFKLNCETQLDYYKKNREGIFCKRYITPKLNIIRSGFTDFYRNI